MVYCCLCSGFPGGPSSPAVLHFSLGALGIRSWDSAHTSACSLSAPQSGHRACDCMVFSAVWLMKANTVNLMVQSGVRTRQCYFYLTFQGLNLYEKDIFGDIKQTNQHLFLELKLGNRGITPTLQGCSPVQPTPSTVAVCSGVTDTHWRPLHKSALTFVTCRASLMVSGFAVLWWVVSACSSASWQDGHC